MAPSDACAARRAMTTGKKLIMHERLSWSLFTISAVVKITAHGSYDRVPTASGSVHARPNWTISWLEGAVIDARKNAVDVAFTSSLCFFFFFTSPLWMCCYAWDLLSHHCTGYCRQSSCRDITWQHTVSTSSLSHRSSKNPGLKLGNKECASFIGGKRLSFIE